MEKDVQSSHFHEIKHIMIEFFCILLYTEHAWHGKITQAMSWCEDQAHTPSTELSVKMKENGKTIELVNFIVQWLVTSSTA